MTNRILIISRAIYYSTSGIQTYIENLCKHFETKNTIVICEYTKKSKELPEYVEIYEVPETHDKSFVRSLIELIKSLFLKKNDLLKKFFLIILLSLNRYAVVSVSKRLQQSEKQIRNGDLPTYSISSVVYPEGLLSIILKLKYNIPAVVLLQGSEIIHFNKNFRIKFLYDFIFRNSDMIVANSEYMKNYLMNFTSGLKNIVANNLGVDTLNFYPQIVDAELKKRLEISEGIKVILSVSNLVYRKGIDILLKALAIVKSLYPHFVYVVVGDDVSKEYKEILDSIIEKRDLKNNVIWTGVVKHENLNPYYNLCDFFVLPARDEAFGLVTFEANACKKAVIGSATGGIKETIIDQKTGLLFEPENEQDLAEKILILLNNSNYCSELGKNAYDRIINEFTWKKSINRLQKLIEKN